MNHKKFTFGVVGAIASAAVTSCAMLIPPCCVGPVLLAAVGVGTASLTTFESLFAYRWLLFGVTFLFIATAYHQTYRINHCDASIAHTKTMQTRRILFWIAVVLIIMMISFPYLSGKVLFRAA
ncbi:MAG TPA: mercuric transporter MerT family protein [Acidobacteriota bacterium]|nr:mercuric transporter MerT family protein [Acidobacteriota bacterium]